MDTFITINIIFLWIMSFFTLILILAVIRKLNKEPSSDSDIEIEKLDHVRNPGDGDQEFRRMPITDSGAWRSRIPTDAEHSF